VRFTTLRAAPVSCASKRSRMTACPRAVRAHLAGKFFADRLHVEVKPFGSDGKAGPARALTFASAEASYSQPGFSVENLVNPASRRGWAVGLSPHAKDHTARFTFTEPVAPAVWRRVDRHTRSSIWHPACAGTLPARARRQLRLAASG